MSGKPMDPERLDDLREGLKWNEAETPGSAACPPVPADLVAELLDDRDHRETHAANIEDRLVECAERFAEAGLVGAQRVVESAISGRMSTHAAKARVVQLTERAETAEAEAKRWRSQCPVTAEHVEADLPAPIEQALAWVDAQGWSRDEHSERHGDEYVYGPKGSIDIKLSLAEQNGAGWVVEVFIKHAAEDTGRPAHDILDEMATAACPDCQGRGEGTVYVRGDGGFSTPEDEPCPTCKGTGRATATPGGDQ